MRRAVPRSTRTVVRCWMSRAGRSRSLAPWVIWAWLVRPRSSARRSSGAQTISDLRWLTAAVRAVTAPALVVMRTRRASRSPRLRGWMRWSLLRTSGAARTASRVSLLRAPPPWWAFGSADLDDAFALSDQECGESGAVAAGSFDCPTAPGWQVLVGELKQSPIAAGVGGGLGATQGRPDGGDRCGGESVAVGVDADDAIDGFGQRGQLRNPLCRRRWVGAGRGGPPCGSGRRPPPGCPIPLNVLPGGSPQPVEDSRIDGRSVGDDLRGRHTGRSSRLLKESALP
jgi:hypothetical protein